MVLLYHFCHLAMPELTFLEAILICEWQQKLSPAGWISFSLSSFFSTLPAICLTHFSFSLIFHLFLQCYSKPLLNQPLPTLSFQPKAFNFEYLLCYVFYWNIYLFLCNLLPLNFICSFFLNIICSFPFFFLFFPLILYSASKTTKCKRKIPLTTM